uniref:Medium-chain acyl-CoA ligase ACSF2, mitochondrial n=1 Tax=Fopius arisanus TaxID=64838 RepID=A0A0C9RZN2_9HYME
MFFLARQVGRCCFTQRSAAAKVKLRIHARSCHNGAAVETVDKSVPDGLSYKFMPGTIPLVDMTVGQLIENAAKQWPDREIFVSVHQGIRMTYKQALARADRIAAGLLKLGLKPGDRVGLWGPNDLEWAIVFMGLVRAGFVAVAINPVYRQGEIDYVVTKVGVTAIVAPAKFKTQDYFSMLENTRTKYQSLKHIILWNSDSRTGAYRLTDVESLGNKIEIEAIGQMQGEISPNNACNIQFTSGTTGEPKAPVLSHRSFVNNAIQSVGRYGDLMNNPRICLNVPFFHAFGIVKGLMTTFCSGATLVIESPIFNPKATINAIAKEKCTGAYGTPTMWINATNAQKNTNAPMESLQWAASGGAHASPDLIKNVIRTFSVENFMTLYGLSELTAIAFSTIPGEPEELMCTSSIWLQHHLEAKVVDKNGSLVPFGTPGELIVKGYSTMMEYWGDPETTSKTLDEGWLKTGDKFILHKDGYGCTVGRIKDMVIRGGENINPRVRYTIPNFKVYF